MYEIENKTKHIMMTQPILKRLLITQLF